MGIEGDERKTWSINGSPPSYIGRDGDGFPIRIYPADSSFPPDADLWMTPNQLAKWESGNSESSSSDETPPEDAT